MPASEHSLSAILAMLSIVGGATAAMLYLGGLARRAPFAFSALPYINWQLKYQAMLLCVAATVLAALRLLNPANFEAFLRIGNIAAPAAKTGWLLIPAGTSWLVLGGALLCFITFGTSTFIYFQFRKSAGGFGALLRFLPWILLISSANAFSEEVVYRLGVVVPLSGDIDTAYVLLISAVAFGAPHLRGMPNGIIGALMAGLLGWLLAKSVVETHGMFWAWLIHSVQDIVIFSAFIMAALNQPSIQPAVAAEPH